MIYIQLFFSFIKVGLFSIGGGYAAMPLIKSEAVTKYSWLTMSEFTDLITIAEMTPGPIAVNSATFVGIRIAGIPGALIATCGCILPSCILISLLALLYAKYKKVSALQGVLSGLRPAVVALIASAGLSILQTVVFSDRVLEIQNVNWSNAIIFVIAFWLLKKCKKNPILVISLCGFAGLITGLIL